MICPIIFSFEILPPKEVLLPARGPLTQHAAHGVKLIELTHQDIPVLVVEGEQANLVARSRITECWGRAYMYVG